MPVVVAITPPIILNSSEYLSEILQPAMYLAALNNPTSPIVTSTSGETNTNIYRIVSGIHKYMGVFAVIKI
jgi:hypothetical protein